MRIRIPETVNYIIQTLTAHGYEAYAVGGCVRDTLLSRTPKDWDVTTSAPPEKVKGLFRRTVDTGIQHGTVTIMIGDTGYEVTTFRMDGKYNDHRHPAEVTFTPSLEEDLKRRDFTINAMAYNEERGLVDLFQGQEDLKRGVIRAVGDPVQRFSEDALRILRCIRFSAQLNFSVDSETYEAAKNLAPDLQAISRERVREELLKILESHHPEKLEELEDIGALAPFYPEFSLGKRERIQLIQKTPTEKIPRLAAFFYDGTGEDLPIADRVLNHLKFDNETRKRTEAMLAFAGEALSEDPVLIRKLLARYSADSFESLLSFRETAEGHSYDKELRAAALILDRGDCVSRKDLKIAGADLIRAGIQPGPQMGKILDGLFDLVLEDPGKNQKEILLKEAARLS